MTILVAIPFYGRPDLLPRAVASVLAQDTRQPFAVCIYADGTELPPLPADPRLRTYRAPVNRGPYYALQAMLLASPYEWIAPIGADDYVDRDHLDRLYRRARVIGVCTTGRVWFHPTETAPPKVARVAYEVGIFRRSRLLDFGGYNPAERLGQDSLLLNLIRLTGPTVASSIPTYHRVRRPDSLTTSPDTARGSPARQALRLRNRTVLARCTKLHAAGKVDELLAYRQSLIPPRVRRALEEDVTKLRRIL